MERHVSWGYCSVKWLRKQCCENDKKFINSLWPSDTICRHKSRSKFAQIMACRLRAPTHYLNQRWLISNMMTSSNGNIFRVTGPLWSPVNSPHKGQWRGALMFSLICARINGWVNTGEAGDLRSHRAYYDVIVMKVQWYSRKYNFVRDTSTTNL